MNPATTTTTTTPATTNASATATATVSSSEDAQEYANAVENHKIHKFVITGGPCSGKTTAMERIPAFLRERGFRVFIVQEAATMLFLNGCSPDDFAMDGCLYAFQQFIIRFVRLCLYLCQCSFILFTRMSLYEYFQNTTVIGRFHCQLC